jgi:lipopolysaccharide/colanic/teichoic acid biosynthesis glycosyltransferase
VSLSQSDSCAAPADGAPLLDCAELLARHDRAWAGHGVCVVRPGGSRAPAGFGLYLLLDGHQVLCLRPDPDRALPRARVVHLSINDLSGPCFESIAADDHGRFASAARRYIDEPAPAPGAPTVLLTSSRRLAQRWRGQQQQDPLSPRRCPLPRELRRMLPGAARIAWPGRLLDAAKPCDRVIAARSPLKGLPQPERADGKRAFDVLVSLVLLALLAPIFVIISVAILLEDGRPILFVQRRQTLGGRTFGCLKFRTMGRGGMGAHTGRDHAHDWKSQHAALNRCDGPHFKADRDPRVTRVGRVLRRLALDELPQLLNVIRGEMSLVGPRPSPNRENQLCPAWRRARLSVRAGITGLWQVRRTRAPMIDFQEWIRYDMEYVARRSARGGWWMDASILLRTPGAIFKPDRPNAESTSDAVTQ